MSPSPTKRMYRRVSTDYIGYCVANHSFQTAVVRDLSLNGLRIEGLSNLPRQSVVTLQIWLPDGEGVIDVERAVVRWRMERECGVQIIALSNAADLCLARHVEQRLRQLAVHPVLQTGWMKIGG